MGTSARPTPAAVLAVRPPVSDRRRGLDEVLVGVRRLAGRRLQVALDGVGPLPGAGLHLRALFGVGPGVRQVAQQVAKPWLAAFLLWREVGPDVERLPVGRQPGRQGPPPAAGHLLADAHVHRVDVRPLLAVDLDGDVVLVEQFRGGLVLKALLFHDVTPVAGGVADREEDGDVPLPRGLERLFVPRLPLDRVVRVLAEVGALGLVEAVPSRRVRAVAHARHSVSRPEKRSDETDDRSP